MSNTTDFNYWIKECHELAVQKGWWEPIGECKIVEYSSRACEKGVKSCVTRHLRSDRELFALMHSEIAEATECVRNGEKPFWLRCPFALVKTECEKPKDVDPRECLTCVARHEQCNPKPCGEAVELIDLCIRYFDYIGYKERGFNRFYANAIYDELELHADLHRMVAMLDTDLAVNTVITYFEKKGWNFEETYKAKFEFNKSRPYRHGGKSA